MSELMWVDDNTSMTEGMVTLFELAGHQVLRAETATMALEYIERFGIGHFSVLIVDVMLTGGSDNKMFSRETTRDFVTTGLILADLIVTRFGDAGRKKLFLYTRATQEWVVRAVEESAKRLNVEWAPRNSQMPPDKFFSVISAMIK